jgi:hypothetical protein
MSRIPNPSVQPLFRSAQLLHPAREDNFVELQALWCEPEVTRYPGDGMVPTREKAAARLAGEQSPAGQPQRNVAKQQDA